MKTSCGIIVTNGEKFLVCHVTEHIQWDIPKGVNEINEEPLQTALREVEEETGISLYDSAEKLIDLGMFDYLPQKNLHLFLFQTNQLPDCSKMLCRSTFVSKEGIEKPEMDGFKYISFTEISANASKVMASVLLRVFDKMRGGAPDVSS